MMGNIPKRKIKDSVFTDLFKNKKYLFQLYQTLHPEDQESAEDDIEDITLKHVLVDAEYNDLGFSAGGRLMILVESQSTWSVNIIIRALMYMMQTYHEYFKRTDQNLYGSRRADLLEPELYMIFTGDRKNIPDTISLSEEFFDGKNTAVNAEVKILYQENEDNIIGQYIIFCKVYNEQRSLHGNTKHAVTETIRICKDREVLKSYLESRETEVVDMMMSLFDDEYILKAYAKEIERDAGTRAEKETAMRMIKDGEMSLEKIAKYVPLLSLEELKELKIEVMKSA